MKKCFNKNLKTLFISVLSVLAIAFCTLAFIGNATPVAKAEVLTSTEYKAIGSSVRVFKSTTDEDGNVSYIETDRQGIRFHVQMGAGYAYNGTTLLDTTQKSEFNGSFELNKNFKTYTLIIPTRLLNGELSMNTDKVMKLETSEYWHADANGNLESVAYVYNVPPKWYTDNFSYRGVICDANDNVLVQTPVLERNLTEIAKKAYTDTIDTTTDYWGSEGLDNTAAGLIKNFIPTYSITYKITDTETKSEDVLWGDKPQNAPTEGVTGAWYDTENSQVVDVSATMNWSENRTIILESTTSEEFVLTGVAAQADFEVGGNTYKGVKVFATLHREAFANKTAMDFKAVKIEHRRGDTVINANFPIIGIWTLDEQNSIGEWGMRLFFAISDEARATLQSGDKLVIKGSSVFYANNIMYTLTEDYTVDYTVVNETEDYGMFLGNLYNSDVFQLTNCAEDPTGNNGKPTEFTIRVEFYEDVLINGEFTFEFGDKSNWGDKTYTHPVYIQCGEDASHLIPVSGGRYYWNEGDHKILELIGAGDYENKVFGWHNGDKLYGAPGTIIKQNGGYYIFQDEMYAYFLASGVDTWGYALGDWVVGEELAKLETSEFSVEGTTAETTDYGTLSDELRINTTKHWFGESKVNILTVEKMDTTAPYAIYCTSENGTVTEISKVRYHGQENPEGGNYQVLGLCNDGKFTAGDVVTIAAGTRFWLGVDYYTVTQKITYYYNGNYWIQNYDQSTMSELSSANFGDRAHNQGTTELRMYFTAPLAGYTTTDNGAFDELRIGTGSITFNGKPVSYVRYQRWDANSTWLSIGGYAGTVAFGDKLVIEEGTTIWGPNQIAYKFTEKIEWLYTDPTAKDANRTWSRILGGVTINATTSNASINGFGTLESGKDYTFNVVPDSGHLISSVTVNYESLPLTDDNAYTFTVEQSNKIDIQAVIGHKVTFTVPEGITVNGGEIENGRFKVVASGSALTFSISANEGYKLLGVSGTTDNGDGTHTISNVTSDKTISISVEKLYKVTYSGENASISANVTNGAWVENGTNITFTVSANSGYTLLDVSNATKVNATTYDATVNGADLNVVATALKNDEFVDITDRIQIEDRAWGVTEDKHAGGSNEVYVGVLDTGITNADGTHYFNTSVNDTWYVGNTAIIEANGGVDIMEYIYVNGVSARKLITDNANGVRNSNACNCWLSNPAAYPVYVETTNGSGLMIRLATAQFGTEFTITIKAGFRITNANGDLVAVTKDVNFNYANTSITKEVVTSQYAVNFSNVTGATVSATVNGSAISSGDKASEGSEVTVTVTPTTGYHIKSVKINGEEKGTNGSYTFTILADTTINVTMEINTYTVNASCEGGVSVDSASRTANHGSSVTFTLTVPDNATIKVGDTIVNGKTYTVSNVTSDTTVKFTTWYNVTVNAGNSTVSGVTNGELYENGTTLNITATGNTGYNVTGITINGSSFTNGGSYEISGATTIAVSTELKTYTVTASCSGSVSVDATSKTVQHGNSVTFTLTVPANATIKANGTVINGTSYTVSNVTANTTITFTTWYNVTVNAGNATVSGDLTGLYQQGDTVDFTVADTVSHTITNVTENGSSIGKAGTYSRTVTGETEINVVTAEKAKYTVSWTNPTGATITVTANETGTVNNGATVYAGQTLTVTVTPSTGYRLDTVTGLGTVTVNKTHATANTFTYTVNAATSISATTVKMYQVNWTVPSNLGSETATITVTNKSNNNATVSKGGYVDNGDKISVTVNSKNGSTITGGSISDGTNTTSITGQGTFDHIVNGKTTINVTADGGGCLVEGTMVTLANGTKKAVEDLKAGDLVLVFNHETGKYDVAPLLCNTHSTAKAERYQIITLTFSNGTQLKIADEHGIFDKTLNKYAYINVNNAYEFIGHEFISVVFNNGVAESKTVTLNNVTITSEEVRIFTPVSAWHINLVADDMLTISGRTVNFFEYDETMKYNEEKMQADIETYGLYTYEDFKDLVSEEVFNAFPFKYFKVAIEKGDYTWDQLMFLLNEYNEIDTEK